MIVSLGILMRGQIMIRFRHEETAPLRLRRATERAVTQKRRIL